MKIIHIAATTIAGISKQENGCPHRMILFHLNFHHLGTHYASDLSEKKVKVIKCGYD